MNPKKIILCLGFILLASVDARSQSGLIRNLQGKWTADCVFQLMNNCVQTSNICPFSMDPKDPGKATIGSIEMTFGADSLTIVKENISTTVPFTENNETHVFTFTYDDTSYSFKVFVHGENLILYELRGTMLYLKK